MTTEESTNVATEGREEEAQLPKPEDTETTQDPETPEKTKDPLDELIVDEEKRPCEHAMCDKPGTEKTMRGSEVWFYCKEHYRDWLKIMKGMGA